MARPIVEQVGSRDGVTSAGFLDATSNFGACAGIWDAGFGEAENDIEDLQNPADFCERNRRILRVPQSRTRTEVDELTQTMNGRGYRAEALHGGMDQQQRDRVMGRLRDGTAEVLIATDVAARGLDVDTLTHVVNYDVPSAAESYVHRIGRVGRAGRKGVAITLTEPRQCRLLGNIERLTKQTCGSEPCRQ